MYLVGGYKCYWSQPFYTCTTKCTYMWSRPQIRTEDHDVYKAYAEYYGLKVHGAYRLAIERAFDADGICYEDGKIVKAED